MAVPHTQLELACTHKVVLHILFCQVHDAEFAPSNSIILSQTLPALAKLKEEGLVKAIGN